MLENSDSIECPFVNVELFTDETLTTPFVHANYYVEEPSKKLILDAVPMHATVWRKFTTKGGVVALSPIELVVCGLEELAVSDQQIVQYDLQAGNGQVTRASLDDWFINSNAHCPIETYELF